MPIFKLIILYWNKNSKHIASLDCNLFFPLGHDEYTEVNGKCELLMHHLISNTVCNDQDLVLQDSVKPDEIFWWKWRKREICDINNSGFWTNSNH